MQKSIRLFIPAIMAAGLFLGMAGCSKQQERYQDPPWLGGSNIETLEKRGNYTIFLKLMEMANYKEPITKQLFTLFVPDDEAFNAYFLERGITSVDDLSKDEAVQLFTLHVLRNPRSRFQLIYEWAWSELQGPNGEYASLFMRKPTPSTSIPYYEMVKYSPVNRIGDSLLIYTGVKNVPLFTTDYFEDFFGAADGSDYLFMYTDSKWAYNYPEELKKKAMNWHNAMVLPNPDDPTELEVRTASGFIYFIDRVVPPMPSIEEYLIAHQDKYSLFYDLMQRFANYTYPKPDEKMETEYLKSYNDVINIAEERGPSTNTVVPPQEMFTAFIPTNAVLQAYLDKFIPKYYAAIDSVPKVTLLYILNTQLSNSLGLISKLEYGYFNSFGDAMSISKNDIESAYMCSNGVIYEMNRVLEPNVFTCVPGHLFFNSNYSTFLYALQAANVLTGLSSPENDVTLFAPTNDMLETYNVRYDKDKLEIQTRGKDGVWKTMRDIDLIMLVQDHVYNGKLVDLSGNGYAEMSSGNFIHYSNSEITAAENQYIGDVVKINETLVNDRNGILYKIDNPIKSNIILGKLILDNPDFSKFAELMLSTKLLEKKADSYLKEQVPVVAFLTQSLFWTAFIPSNAAMTQAEADGLIPAKDAATKDQALKDFLLYHFVRNYALFDDGLQSGVFPTNRSYSDPNNGVQYSTLEITNSLNSLSITDHSGQVVNVDHADANLLVRKGVAHKINSVLKY